MKQRDLDEARKKLANFPGSQKLKSVVLHLERILKEDIESSNRALEATGLLDIADKVRSLAWQIAERQESSENKRYRHGIGDPGRHDIKTNTEQEE